MSIFGLARAPTNLFLLITHNFQAVQRGRRLVPGAVRSEGCRDCLFICLFIYTDPPHTRARRQRRPRRLFAQPPTCSCVPGLGFP